MRYGVFWQYYCKRKRLIYLMSNNDVQGYLRFCLSTSPQRYPGRHLAAVPAPVGLSLTPICRILVVKTTDRGSRLRNIITKNILFSRSGRFLLTFSQVLRPNLWSTDSIIKVSVRLWSDSKLSIASGFRGLRDLKRGERAF